MATYYVATTGNDTTGDGSIGNPYASPGKAAAATTASGKVFLKSGTYTLTTSTPGAGGPVVFPNAITVLFEGYENSPGDLGAAPLISAGAITGLAIVTSANDNSSAMCSTVNIEVDGANGAENTGFSQTGGAHYRGRWILCKAVNCPGKGFSYGQTCGCWASGNGTGFYRTVSVECTSESNSGDGFDCYLSSGTIVAVECISRNNGGKGFSGPNALNIVYRCTSYGNAGDAFDDGTYASPLFVNCHADSCGGYGYNTVSTALLINCADYHNTMGRVHIAPLADYRGVTITYVDGSEAPMTSATDMRPNDVALGGHLLRAAAVGPPGQTHTADIGAMQHSDSSGYTYGDEDPDEVLTTADGAGNAHGDTDASKVFTTASAPGSYDPSLYELVTTGDTRVASQLSTDQGVVLAAAGSIKDNATILGQAGAYDFTAAIAAGYNAGAADRLAYDRAAVAAVAAYMTTDIVALLGTVDGTIVMANYTLTSGIVWPVEANVSDVETAWGPTGEEYAGALDVAALEAAAASDQHDTDAAFLETNKAEIIPADTAILAEFGVTGTAPGGGIDPADLPATKYVYYNIDRGDGTLGILRASTIAAAAGSGVALSAEILVTGNTVDDVVGEAPVVDIITSSMIHGVAP